MSVKRPVSVSDCLAVLNQFKGWNTQQQSASLAFGGPRESVDDLYDARRELLRAATERLARLVGSGGGE